MDFSKIEEQIDRLIKLQDGWLRTSGSQDESPDDGDTEIAAPSIEAIIQAEEILHELFFYSKVLKEDLNPSLYPMAYPEGIQIEIDITESICLTIEIANNPSLCRIWLMDTRDLTKASELEFKREDSLGSSRRISDWLQKELKQYITLEN